MGHRRSGLTTVLIVALFLAGCADASRPGPTPVVAVDHKAADTAISPRASGDTVTASGKIVPAQEAQLGFAVSGRVKTVTVTEGCEVQSGETLVALEIDTLQADVARAEAALVVAQAELARLSAGPQPGEVAAAKARLEAAVGGLAQAEARQDELSAGATEAEVAAAQAELAAAEAEWIAARIADDQLHARGKAEEWEEEESILRRRAAELARVAAEAKAAQSEDGTEVRLRAARAAVSSAAAQRDVAQAQLALLQAGTAAEELAIAEENVALAQAAVQIARAALEQATLRAPFPGVVTALEVSPGETVVPGREVLTL
ncbi:MAG: biotin/lipoyl-binding protein, partial [Anaerolineae bacterium]